MTKILLLIFVLGLISCSETNKQSESKTSDTTSTQDVVVNEYELALIYRDLDSDSLLADKDDQLKLLKFLTKGIKIKEKEYGSGDCEGKFKQLALHEDTLTIDKYDCGDYGFGNTEFILDSDSLKYVREFKIEWSPDDKENELSVSETTYEFTSSNLKKRTRTKSIKGWKDFRIDDVNFEESTLPGHEEYNKFKKELKNITLKEKLGE
jgi:hypothetical protein